MPRWTKVANCISIHAPLRERRVSCKTYSACENFNPRSLAGATRRLIFAVLFSIISIHAPSRERLARAVALTAANVFQSTLPRGSDVFKACHFKSLLNFNPRSLAGATYGPFLIYGGVILFQSTLPRGSDLALRSVYRLSVNFNPRSLAGAT